MLKRVLKYLDTFYYVEEGEVYRIDAKQRRLRYNAILTDISDVFGTPRFFNLYVLEKWYISNGIEFPRDRPTRFVSPGVYTREFDHSFMPIAQRVTARTMGLDLVPVQPMDLPVGKLFYFTPKLKLWSRIKMKWSSVKVKLSNKWDWFTDNVVDEVLWAFGDAWDWVKKRVKRQEPVSVQPHERYEDYLIAAHPSHERLVERWRNTGLLEGLEDSPQREIIAQLLESQASQLLEEPTKQVEYNEEILDFV